MEVAIDSRLSVAIANRNYIWYPAPETLPVKQGADNLISYIILMYFDLENAGNIC